MKFSGGHPILLTGHPILNLSPQVRFLWRWKTRRLSASGPWLRNGTGPGGGRMCDLEDTVCGLLALRVLCFVSLGQRNVLQPLPAWPQQHQQNNSLVGAPPCGYCSDDCHLCYKTETDVLGRAGQVGGPCRAPGLLPGQCLSCTPLLPSQLHPTFTPACPRGSSHTLSLIQDSTLDPAREGLSLSLADPLQAGQWGFGREESRLAKSTR